MKINEILDSSKSWSSLAGVDLTITDDFQQKYRRIIQTIKTVEDLRSIIPYEVWLISVTAVVAEATEFLTLAADYITSIRRLNIKNDSDLSSRVKKVKRMQESISNYLDHLIV